MKTIHYLLNHNSLEQVALSLCVAAAVFFALLFARNFLVRRLRLLAQRTVSIWDDVLVEVIAATKVLFLFALSVAAGTTQIELPDKIEHLPYKVMMVLLILQVGVWAANAIATAMDMRLANRREAGDGAAVTNLGVAGFVARMLVWVVVLLLLLDNLGINITTLVASLGIGGIAVALALQNILGDLFASLSIAIDKPFVVGDFIIVDELMGTVNNVGLKTTRLQSLSGEELIFSNNDLLKSRIRNYKHMAERRVLFGFGVTYDTPPATLQALVSKIQQIIEAEEGTRFDRAHFKGFSASSLDIEVVYYMLSADFNPYMDTQQRINLALLDYCKDQGISFAFPTQILHVASLPAATQSAAPPADMPGP
jgi:small-conductance mechanosensitive channel